MLQNTAYRNEALDEDNYFDWQQSANYSYVREAGWYFKTLAVQEVGKQNCLHATNKKKCILHCACYKIY